MLWAKRGWESDRFFLPRQQMPFLAIAVFARSLLFLLGRLMEACHNAAKYPMQAKGAKPCPMLCMEAKNKREQRIGQGISQLD